MCCTMVDGYISSRQGWEAIIAENEGEVYYAPWALSLESEPRLSIVWGDNNNENPRPKVTTNSPPSSCHPYISIRVLFAASYIQLVLCGTCSSIDSTDSQLLPKTGYTTAARWSSKITKTYPARAKDARYGRYLRDSPILFVSKL